MDEDKQLIPHHGTQPEPQRVGQSAPGSGARKLLKKPKKNFSVVDPPRFLKPEFAAANSSRPVVRPAQKLEPFDLNASKGIMITTIIGPLRTFNSVTSQIAEVHAFISGLRVD
jgi:hypothetical protein